MTRTDDDAQRETLEEWTADLSDALRLAGLDVGLAVDVAAILSLAGDAAHTVLRPAAPLTTFVVGFAAGRAAGAGTDPATAVADAIAATHALLAEHQSYAAVTVTDADADADAGQ
ncbi:hypothetical protein B7R54_14070 [Subtercola boreus]|uniref:DUF6457 domain-containing protein n=1 Tax=Subtercola boreus TaxID=120213 RepID=A0A3E0VL45_9MICO|nr:DUF6457 domain-containing protein [Subtercola boreus]RFA10208.1 hypothetical protein B7R54_14070 [Subtercola boreus]TQL52620.1 hypothetical protein FB464_0103 [Subtercola boreus]